MIEDHVTWMQQALQESRKAYEKDEVPVGAVIVQDQRIIGKGYNLIESLQDPTAHAEMLAITAAANSLASWRLDDATIYVTLEPCPMCTGAILFSRIRNIVFGAPDPRYGACGSALQVADNDGLDVKANIVSGILEEESRELLQQFFRKIRQRSK